MAEGDDMNSTPLAKLLELPAAGDAARAAVPTRGSDSGGDVSYAQILERLNASRDAPPVDDGAGDAPALPPVRAVRAPLAPARAQAPTLAPAGEEDEYPAYPAYPAYTYPTRPAAHAYALDRPARKPRAPKKKKLAFLRPALIVGLIVFFVLRQGAPRIARLVPMSVDAATGKFTIAGLLLVSALSGGAYLGITELFAKVIDGGALAGYL